MASSAGRDKLRGRPPRNFAFGSSTPRDLSHLNKVPPQFRYYDAKAEKRAEGPSLRDYILKARSLSREGNDNRKNFVFGSSTPRHLAHLDKIPTHQRVYDAKLPKKSATHEDFKASPIRCSTVPPPIRKPERKEEEEKIHVITSKDDEIASEPDIVQDREEFMKEMREHKKSLEKKISPIVEKPVHNEIKFAHAPEIASNTQKTSRAHSETHEAAPIAVENVSANKMNDQIEVSQLNEEISNDEASSPAASTIVVDNLLAKVQQIAGDATDKVKEIVTNVNRHQLESFNS
ncbi:unnamed protein product [Caenorhabditis bovis]|uniref:Uncharacterized protein n=1 Tax=Caenorhabditis bovis TaxID=2654633 RepID=A0A8S1ETT1_9PELO|nr:unnamed protein product [Caenorhabditis bovis]